jgi:hypothetical protein
MICYIFIKDTSFQRYTKALEMVRVYFLVLFFVKKFTKHLLKYEIKFLHTGSKINKQLIFIHVAEALDKLIPSFKTKWVLVV